jgi:hypothetical protein
MKMNITISASPYLEREPSEPGIDKLRKIEERS